MKKRLRLMFDPWANPLWFDWGDNPTPQELNISFRLCEKINQWNTLNMLWFDWNYPPDSITYPWQKKLIKILWREIWKELIKEIGNKYEIFYFEDNKLLSPEEIK